MAWLSKDRDQHIMGSTGWWKGEAQMSLYKHGIEYRER